MAGWQRRIAAVEPALSPVQPGCSRTAAPACGSLHPEFGEVPEWSIGAVSKTVVRASVPWVRIPPSPPSRSFNASLDPIGTLENPNNSNTLTERPVDLRSSVSGPFFSVFAFSFRTRGLSSFRHGAVKWLKYLGFPQHQAQYDFLWYRGLENGERESCH